MHAKASAQITLIAVFLAALILPTVDNGLSLDPATPLVERRALSGPPHIGLSLESVKGFPDQFEAFYRDHFGFRSSLIRLNSAFHVFCLGVSPLPDKVMVGKGDWLFYVPRALGYQRAVRPFSAGELAAWQRVFEDRQRWLADQGIPSLFLIAPDKHTIYPDRLPAAARRVGGPSRLDQLLAHLRVHSDVQILDVRSVLASAREGGDVYWRTDSHWNMLGAYLVSREVLHRARAWLPDVHPAPLDLVRSPSRMTRSGDLAEMLSIETLVSEADQGMQRLTRCHGMRIPPTGPSRARRTVFDCEDGPPRRLLLYHDSFGLGLLRFLAPSFGRMVGVWSNRASPNLVLAERPDIVVFEFVERDLMGSMPRDPPRIRGYSTRPRAGHGEASTRGPRSPAPPRRRDAARRRTT